MTRDCNGRPFVAWVGNSCCLMFRLDRTLLLLRHDPSQSGIYTTEWTRGRCLFYYCGYDVCVQTELVIILAYMHFRVLIERTVRVLTPAELVQHSLCLKS